MAERQRTGMPFTQEQLVFINQAVSVKPFGCGSEIAEGWYANLFFDKEEALKFDPTIADVHTQPSDEQGVPVGKVLHVGTGYPRMMVTTVNTCQGPRAYAGVVYAYHELVTKNFERLTDQQWAQRFGANGERPAEVEWIGAVLGH